MKRKNFRLLALIPSFTLVSVVGAGFATWYFSEANSIGLDGDVVFTDPANVSFSIEKPSTNLILDQKVKGDRPTNAEDGMGVFLTDEEGYKNDEKDTNGVAIKFKYNGTINSETDTVSLYWTASWSDEESAKTYLTLQGTDTEALTVTDWETGASDGTSSATVYLFANQTQDANPEVTKNKIYLGIDYSENGEPDTYGDYTNMKEVLANLQLKVNFTVSLTHTSSN